MTIDQDIILQTKLQCPRIKGRILERPRLINLLCENLDKKLIIISADAGYGKTTLLSQLCTKIEKNFIFYSLDAKDSDMTVFFNYLLCGIKNQVNGFGNGLAQILGKTRDIPIVVGTFINEFLEQVKGDFHLIVDDFHYTQNNRELNEAIVYLLHHAPANLHLIIASRINPAFNFDSYKSKQELLFVGKDRLRFDAGEIKLLLKEAYNITIIDQEIERIIQHTEGWITAIQLILQKVCAAGAETTKQILNGYLVSGEDIFNYFAREVYESQPTPVKEFLVQTSILDTLTPEICDYLLNSKKSKAILEHLDSANLFLSRVGNSHKYHPIFHEFLARKLSAIYPGQKIKKLFHQVAEFSAMQKDYVSSVNYYLHAEDYRHAARIIETKLLVHADRISLATCVALINRIPETVVSDFPRLVMSKVRYWLDRGRVEYALRMLQGINGVVKKSNNRRYLHEMYFLFIDLHMERIEPLQALHFAQLAYDLSKKLPSKFKHRVLLQFGYIYRVLGNYRKAEKYLQETLRLARKTRDTQAETNAMRHMAYFYWSKFDYHKAEDIFADFLTNSREPDYELGMIYIDAAMMATYNRHFQRAADYLKKAEHIAVKYNDLKFKRGKLFAQGDLYYQLGEYRKAVDSYQEAYEMRTQIEEKFYDINILISMAMAYLKLDNINAAEQCMKETDSIMPPIIHPTIMIEYTTVKGEIEKYRGRYGHSMKYFKKAAQDSIKYAQPYQEMIVHYNLAGLHMQRKAPAEALEAMKKALSIARTRGYENFLITEGIHDINLIKLAVENDHESGYLRKVLHQIDTEGARDLLFNASMGDGDFAIECNFFGYMSLRDHNGKTMALNWRTKKCRSILAFLVVNRERGCTKEQLIDTYWPDKKIAAAAHSLQVEISAIRKELVGIIPPDVDDREPVIFKNQRYQINPRIEIKTDIGEFDNLRKKAQTESNKTACRQILQKALELYRGDFCPDIMENWAENLRLFYKDAVLKIIKNLAELCYDAKEYRQALDNFQQALGYDEYDEAIHAGIIRCFAAMGNKHAIMQQYRLLKQNLKSIGISQPSPGTTRIYEQCIK